VPEPVRLPLTREAEVRLELYARELVQRAHEASGILAGALGKARGHALRLAAVLKHLWWCAQGGPPPAIISADAMLAALGLIDGYFIPMAERVFGDATIPAKERAAMIPARLLRRRGGSTFHARELRREIGGALRDTAAMEVACAVLVEAGLIRPAFTRTGDTKGRRSRKFEVNPAVTRA
jgi:hypothetical protein